MVTIKWCLKQASGIRIIEPNENISKGYINMADSAIGTMNREKGKNDIFSVSAGYYSMYYSVYSVLIRIGIKCEIHACTLKIMEKVLNEFYSREDIQNINMAFKLRNKLQYYVDKIIDEYEKKKLLDIAPDFLVKSKNTLLSLNEEKINKIRRDLKKEIGEGENE